MNILELAEKNVLVNVPSDLDEMTPQQYRYVMQQVVFLNAGRIDEDAFRLRVFYKLANIQRDWRTILWERFSSKTAVEEKNANAYILSKIYTGFLFKPSEKNEKQLEINYDSVVNYLPVLKAGASYHGPADLLQDLTFGEFSAAIEYMNQYFLDKEIATLNMMIACLYRPAGGNPDNNGGRIREPFNKYRIIALAKPLNKIQPWQRTAILLWFTWCIKCLQVEDLIINGRKINLSPLFPGAGKKEKTGNKPGSGLGWTSVLFNLSKENVFGDIEKVERTDFFDVLLFMYDNHLQNQRNKKK